MLKRRFKNLRYEYTYQDWIVGVIKAEELEILVETGRLSQVDYDSIIYIQQSRIQPEAEVEHYQYSYENWLKGDIKPNELLTLFIDEELEPEAYNRIINEQDQAYLKRLADSLEALKAMFKESYENSLIKREYLKETLQETKRSLETIKLNHEHIYKDALYGLDDRRELTAKQVNEYLCYELNTDNTLDLSLNLLCYYEVAINAFHIILKSNYLDWLYWFKAQQKKVIDEPKINISTSRAESEIKALSKMRGSSYKWLNNPKTELPELYQLLLDNKLIHADTTLEQLKAVFTAKPLLTLESIKWHDDNASELLYFILQLEDSDNIEKGKQTNYIRLTKCFVKPNGDSFDEKFKSLKTRIGTDLSEPKQQTIKGIISNFQ